MPVYLPLPCLIETRAQAPRVPVYLPLELLQLLVDTVIPELVGCNVLDAVHAFQVGYKRAECGGACILGNTRTATALYMLESKQASLCAHKHTHGTRSPQAHRASTQLLQRSMGQHAHSMVQADIEQL